MDEGGGRDRPTDLKETRTLVEFAVAKSIFYTGRAWRRDFCEWTTARGGGSELFSWMTTRGRRRPPRRTRLLDDDFDVDENENENCDDSEEDDARIRDAICGSLRHCMYAGRDERLEALCDVAIAVMSRPESQHRQAADALAKVAALVPDEIRQAAIRADALTADSPDSIPSERQQVECECVRRATYLFLSGISAAIARAATGDALPRSAASAAVEFANHLCRSWEDGFDASEPDSKLRARLLIATAMKDAERWIERSRPRQDDPPADADEEEELRDVEDPKVTAERTRSALFLKELEVALAKNQALMDVLRHLGYTEDGKKLAAATNYDGDSRIASVSVAISTPSPVTQRMLGMMADRLPLDTLGLSVANGFAAGTPVGRVVRDEREKDPESVPAALVDLALLRGAIASLARCARSNVENSAGGEEEREKLQAATASACGVLYHAIGWLTCRLRPQITKRTRDVDPKYIALRAAAENLASVADSLCGALEASFLQSRGASPAEEKLRHRISRLRHAIGEAGGRRRVRQMKKKRRRATEEGEDDERAPPRRRRRQETVLYSGPGSDTRVVYFG